MPELPEVETIARELREGHPTRGPSVVGKTIVGVMARWPRHIARVSVSEFKRRLPGQTVAHVGRRGKYLVFQLTRDVLLIHLKMTGDLQVVDGRAEPDPYARTIIHFADGTHLRFGDARKFGRVYLVERVEEVTGSLGPEPLARGFTAAELSARLAERRRRLKPLLLDQAFIAGLGNIYTDEALHLAKLHPLRRSDTVRPAEVRALWRGIRRALQAGLRHNGASLDWVYRGGSFQHHFRVYDRAGEPCRRCRTSIRRIVVGQRGTYFCPRCQRPR